MKKKKLLNIECSSPEELNRIFSDLLTEGKPQSRFVALTIHGPQVLVRQFELPRLSMRELTHALRLEAIELLHIPLEEVELEYQTLGSAEDKLKGVFIAAPKSLIAEFIACCDQAGFIPVEMTASILAAVESFCHQNKTADNSVCLLDFRPVNRINLAVFDGATCVLLREIHYENPDEAEHDVIDSLKYSFTKSTLKQLNEIYVAGDAPGIDTLIQRLQKEFDVTAQRGDFTDISCSGASSSHDLFAINLLKPYAVSFPLRNRIAQVEHIAVALLLLACIVVAITVARQQSALQAMRSSFQIKDYDYAKQLAERIKALENAE
jgi:hypothetical protein